MQYLTLNLRNETIERIMYYGAVKENKIDALAELEEVKKRNPLIRTKAYSESSHYGGSENHSLAVILDAKQKALEKQLADYDNILYGYEKGYRLLDEQEKELLELRYHQKLTQQQAADMMGFSLSRIKQINNSLLNKMQNQMLWY